MPSILLLNGPNLNLLGKREPDLYGSDDLTAIQQRLEARAHQAGYQLQAFQSNAEHELIQAVHATLGDASVECILINPAAFTHTSVALRDALLAVNKPFIEVHISNIFAREPFRHHSYFSDVASGVICGLGVMGYELALEAALRLVKQRAIDTLAGPQK
jgi:3-dehydroquinate dehydratase-2